MKKLVLIIVFMIFGLSSCHRDRITEIKEVLTTMFYFRDSKTGLCYAAVTNYNQDGNVTCITCVPCDSLKKIGIK